MNPCYEHKLTLLFFDNVYLAGKAAMTSGAGMFNKAASNEYKMLPRTEKEKLKELSVKTVDEDPKEMTVKEIKKTAAKAFRKIKIQVGYM